MKKFLFVFALVSSGFCCCCFAQTIRYQQSVRGGFTFAANALLINSSTFAKTDGGTTCSSYSDLVLPAGSTISKAILYIENHSGGNPITSVKFKVAGSTSYMVLNNTSTGFLGNPVSSSYAQFIFDVTALIPSSGYISTYTAGGNATNAGRYSVADPGLASGAIKVGYGWGWTLFVVYTNPGAQYRSITIADGCNNLGSPVNVDVTGIQVPSSGTVKAVVAMTGSWGDVDAGGLSQYKDYARFGKTTGTLTNLADPTTGRTDDALGSTIGMGSQNNVTADGGPTISGSYTARNPYNTFTVSGSTTSCYYDCDLFNASNIIPPSATPINARFQQESPSIDALGSGAYAISVDIVASLLTKSVAPSSIGPGQVATYTFVIENTGSGALNLSNIGFSDNIPSALQIANPNCASVTGGSGGTITAAPGSNSFTLNGLSLPIGATATLTICVEAKPGQSNGDCSTNPAAFTNAFTSISSTTANLANGVSPQCLEVSLVVPLELIRFNGRYEKGRVNLNWSTASEKNSDRIYIERLSKKGYEEIGSVKAAGNSSNARHYSFKDMATGGLQYYRLKLQDFNGDYKYSKTLAIDIPAGIFSILNVAFNGENLSSSIEIATAGTYSYTLRDLNGRTSLLKTVSYENAGSTTQSFSTLGLQAGLYFLEISGPNGVQARAKVLKGN